MTLCIRLIRIALFWFVQKKKRIRTNCMHIAGSLVTCCKEWKSLTRLAADFCCMLLGFVIVEKNNEINKKISVYGIKHIKETQPWLQIRIFLCSMNSRLSMKYPLRTLKETNYFCPYWFIPTNTTISSDIYHCNIERVLLQFPLLRVYVFEFIVALQRSICPQHKY